MVTGNILASVWKVKGKAASTLHLPPALCILSHTPDQPENPWNP